tara:strand:- start:7652 stop:7954 length:303 start_codon:yes stop_codon:yes gene_type:complete
MRELAKNEIEAVAGGLGGGLKIPFVNGFIKAESMNGKPAAQIGAAVLAFQAGWHAGQWINQFNQEQFGMSLGVAIHRSFNGGSNIKSGDKLEPTTRIEEI